jgi:hypothetical protein
LRFQRGCRAGGIELGRIARDCRRAPRDRVALLEFNFMLAKLILIPPLLPLKFEGRLFGHRLGLYLVSIELMDAAENG